MKNSNNKLYESKRPGLIVESLKLSHLSMLNLSKQSKHLGWKEITLIRSLLSQAECLLQGLIPTRQPRCLAALESNKLIAISLIQPNNRRGSSWSISVPQFLKEPLHFTYQEVREILLDSALNIEHNAAQSWLIRCQADDKQQLELSRSKGFQPLKVIKRWTINQTSTEKDLIKPSSLSKDVKWEDLSRKNAPLLSRLKNGSDSVHLRELIGRNWIDLLDKNVPPNKVLISSEGNKVSALFGLVTPIACEDRCSLELIRDFAWDSRLNYLVPTLIKSLASNQSQVFLESSTEDQKLNNILKQSGWNEINEKILLGRSRLIRKITPKYKNSGSSFEKIFDSLQTNQPPLPSPIM
tara:strand:- start:497 stop:1555 length:1059 start_codon:yes stop_codon:yes gene_type:complete